MITALNVANTFLARSKQDNVDVTPMKLQRLIYIFYKEYLKKTNEKLFEEKFEVWKYGPVLSDVYYAFQKYRANAIDDFYYDDDKKNYTTVKLIPGTAFYSIFNDVWGKYSHYSGTFLSDLTHQEGTSWSKADCRNDSYLEDREIFEEESYNVTNYWKKYSNWKKYP